MGLGPLRDRFPRLAAIGVALLLSLGTDVRATPTAPIAAPAGSLRGTREGDVAVYRGVPYALPPVGPLRWRPPQPMPRWQGVREAAAFSAACMQSGPTFPGMPAERVAEDCLYLNLWVPARADRRMPVMVFLHGGAMRNGSGSTPLYDGRNLARTGVIVVTVNYRLGALGFLAHPGLSREQGGASGDYGLMDMVAALRWVRDNVAAFGGDPRNVTLFGQSAGSWSISRLIVAPPGPRTVRAGDRPEQRRFRPCGAPARGRGSGRAAGG